MKPHEVLDMIAPPASECAKVVNWVRSRCPSGVTKLDNRRDTVRVEASVACVKRLFPSVRLSKYKHSLRRAHVIRLHPSSPMPAVPSHLRSIVDMVIGLDMLPVVRKRKMLPLKQVVPAPDTKYDYIYPGDINRVYNIASNVIKPGSKSTQSVIEFYPEGAPLWQDLQLFDQWSQIPFNNFSKIVGPFSPGNDGESLLDIQLITAVAQTPTAYITIPDGWVYSMAQELFTMVNPPLVNSVSYGWPEALTCQSDVTNAHCNSAQDPKAYVIKAELEMQKATALGLSFSICSQDEGAPSEQNESCQLDGSQPVW
jgi:subtilase family serine protease